MSIACNQQYWAKQIIFQTNDGKGSSSRTEFSRNNYRWESYLEEGTLQRHGADFSYLTLCWKKTSLPTHHIHKCKHKITLKVFNSFVCARVCFCVPHVCRHSESPDKRTGSPGTRVLGIASHLRGAGN